VNGTGIDLDGRRTGLIGPRRNRLEAEVGWSPIVVLADQDKEVRRERLQDLPARTWRVIGDGRLKRTAGSVLI
jgi:hypothetical protein